MEIQLVKNLKSLYEKRILGTSEAQNTEISAETSPMRKNPDAVALGRLGGLKGGDARAKKLSPEKRTEISRKAANVRWEKARETGGLFLTIN